MTSSSISSKFKAAGAAELRPHDQLRSQIFHDPQNLPMDRANFLRLRAFSRVSDLRHPRSLGATEVQSFSSDFVIERQPPPSNSNQAPSIGLPEELTPRSRFARFRGNVVLTRGGGEAGGSRDTRVAVRRIEQYDVLN